MEKELADWTADISGSIVKHNQQIAKMPSFEWQQTGMLRCCAYTVSWDQTC